MKEKWFPKNEIDVHLGDNSWLKEIKDEITDDFYEKRKKGENESEICKLVQKDMIKEFIIYTNKEEYSLQSIIETSIFETNSLFLKVNPTIIEYTAFYGAIQIFKYLQQNEVKLTSKFGVVFFRKLIYHYFYCYLQKMMMHYCYQFFVGRSR